MRYKKKVKIRAFTIVELLVVISILVFLFFIVVPIFMNIPSERERRGAIKEGQPIVEAIYRYKNDKGLWPQYTEDFIPDYLEALPNDLWNYSEDHLRLRFKKSRSWIGYNFRSDYEGWVAGGESGASEMDVEQSKPVPLQLTEEKLATNIINEFNRRIQREPKNLEYYKRSVSYLILVGQKNTAIELCQDAVKVMPDEWWPRLAQAALLFQDNGDKTASESFEQWVKSNRPEFAYYYYLCYLYQIQDEHEKALQILKSAMQNCSAEERLGREYAAALYAYRQKDYQLAIDICNRMAAHPWNVNYYLPIRAACYLAVSEKQKAEDDMKKALKKLPGYRYNLEELNQAVKKNDSDFVYAPNEEREFDVLMRKPEEILHYVP